MERFWANLRVIRFWIVKKKELHKPSNRPTVFRGSDVYISGPRAGNPHGHVTFPRIERAHWRSICMQQTPPITAADRAPSILDSEIQSHDLYIPALRTVTDHRRRQP
jgi:hypothetical protein